MYNIQNNTILFFIVYGLNGVFNQQDKSALYVDEVFISFFLITTILYSEL